MGELLKSVTSQCSQQKEKAAKSHYSTKVKATDEGAEDKEGTNGSSTASPETGTSAPVYNMQRRRQSPGQRQTVVLKASGEAAKTKLDP